MSTLIMLSDGELEQIFGGQKLVQVPEAAHFGIDKGLYQNFPTLPESTAFAQTRYALVF